MQDGWVLAGMLLIGFLWLRAKARKLGPEGLGARAFLAFGVMGPVILVLPWVSGKLPFGRTYNLAVELLALGAAFLVSGTFLRPRNPAPKGLEAES